MSSCSCNIDKEIIIKIPILEDEGLMIERLWYEVEGLKNLLTQFTSDSPFKPDENRYDKLLNYYIEKFCEYSICWNYINDKYAKEYLGSKYSILINFTTVELEVSLNTDCQSNC